MAEPPTLRDILVTHHRRYDDYSLYYALAVFASVLKNPPENCTRHLSPRAVIDCGGKEIDLVMAIFTACSIINDTHRKGHPHPERLVSMFDVHTVDCRHTHNGRLSHLSRLIKQLSDVMKSYQASDDYSRLERELIASVRQSPSVEAVSRILVVLDKYDAQFASSASAAKASASVPQISGGQTAETPPAPVVPARTNSPEAIHPPTELNPTQEPTRASTPVLQSVVPQPEDYEPEILSSLEDISDDEEEQVITKGTVPSSSPSSNPRPTVIEKRTVLPATAISAPPSESPKPAEKNDVNSSWKGSERDGSKSDRKSESRNQQSSRPPTDSRRPDISSSRPSSDSHRTSTTSSDARSRQSESRDAKFRGNSRPSNLSQSSRSRQVNSRERRGGRISKPQASRSTGGHRSDRGNDGPSYAFRENF